MPQNLSEAISYLSSIVERVMDETISEVEFSDLTYQQLHYLITICNLNDPTLTELARALRLTKPTVTVQIDKLVEKGYVRKVTADHDKRVIRLHVGEKCDKIKSLRKIAMERMTNIVKSGLNETETSILLKLLKKISHQAT